MAKDLDHSFTIVKTLLSQGAYTCSLIQRGKTLLVRRYRMICTQTVLRDKKPFLAFVVTTSLISSAIRTLPNTSPFQSLRSKIEICSHVRQNQRFVICRLCVVKALSYLHRHYSLSTLNLDSMNNIKYLYINF